MKAKKIQTSDIKELLVSSLPTRPTAPKSLGGKGFGAKEMKEAFDKLPLYIIEILNALLDDVSDLGENSLAAAIPTGIKNGHTLYHLFCDIDSGALATYFSFLGKTLTEHILYLYGEIEALKKHTGGAETTEEKQ